MIGDSTLHANMSGMMLKSAPQTNSSAEKKKKALTAIASVIYFSTIFQWILSQIAPRYKPLNYRICANLMYPKHNMKESRPSYIQTACLLEVIRL